MELLEGAVRDYHWGSVTAIPDLLGRPPTTTPVAELWLGAHPAGPALVGASARPLDELISQDPDTLLGAGIQARFGGLPFMMKVLAAAEPLSLQVHPSTAQAEAGFAREDDLGVPLDAPERTFRDRSHKPELICALTPFDALCGFRDPAATIELLDTIDTEALDPVRQRLRAEPDAGGLRRLLEWLLELDADSARSLTGSVIAACAQGGPVHGAAERAMVSAVGARHPRDPGVVTALLLNLVRLAPGEGLFLGERILHAYLHGVGVEVMANSDNVLRGGLTTKHIDVATLLRVVDTHPISPTIQSPRPADGVVEYEAPVPEFSLSRYEVEETAGEAVTGPAVLLCTAGAVAAGAHTLDRGTAAWLPASDPPVVLEGRGTVFRAGVGRLSPTLAAAEG